MKTIFALKGNFAAGHRPSKKAFDGVEIVPFKNNARAAVCISADFEMNWAFRDWSSQERNLRGDRTRRNFRTILKLLEDHKIPITWATVGHLFLEGCERDVTGKAHANMPRPPLHTRWKGDWYLHDPCTNAAKDPLWYSPDLIQEIIENKVPHEIGTHSFSHVEFSPLHSNAELIRREMEESILSMESFGLWPRSLVYPYNTMGHAYLGLLSQFKIAAVRHRDRRVRLSYPERTEFGVYKIYESMNLRKAKHYDYLDKVKIFLEKASQRQAVYHLWFHPSDPVALFRNEFRRIVQFIAGERDKGKLWAATMADIAAYCEAREHIRLRVKRESNDNIGIVFENPMDIVRYGTSSVTLSLRVKEIPKKILLEDQRGVFALREDDFRVDSKRLKLLINAPPNAKELQLSF